MFLQWCYMGNCVYDKMAPALAHGASGIYLSNLIIVLTEVDVGIIILL